MLHGLWCFCCWLEWRTFHGRFSIQSPFVVGAPLCDNMAEQNKTNQNKQTIARKISSILAIYFNICHGKCFWHLIGSWKMMGLSLEDFFKSVCQFLAVQSYSQYIWLCEKGFVSKHKMILIAQSQIFFLFCVRSSCQNSILWFKRSGERLNLFDLNKLESD